LALRIYDTLRREKIEFEPLEPGKVKIYVCGMTVQDRPHIGHIRSDVVSDVIRRYLEHIGYEVIFVCNFTDVDDKIIEKAAEEGVEYKDIAQRNIDAYFRAVDALGVKRATFYPRATEHIPEILEMIDRLKQKGYAYESGGDVYYEVRRKKDYGKLSRRAVDDLRSGARIEVGEDKRDALDFALWKSAKPGEVSWDSPAGPGRPGWHIECSAMSMKYLGETFDIHRGGVDLIFPHHENEIAQSEAANDKPFVRNWMHHGMVNIGGQKMSKSEKRFFLVDEVLEEYLPEVVRFYLLSTHYRSPIEFSRERLDEARVALERITQTLERFGGFAESAGEPSGSGEIAGVIKETDEKFHAAMDDDFNSAKALGHLFDLARASNRVGEVGDEEGARAGARKIVVLGRSLGLFLGGPRKEEQWSEEVLTLVGERQTARENKDWGRADEIRDQLRELGLMVEDGSEGPKIKRIAAGKGCS
jgi:cysteinyl-tRNA synthetase